MVEEKISPEGFIRNTPSDKKELAERQLRVGRSTWPLEKNNAKLCRTKKVGGERGEFIGLHLPLAGGGNWSRGPIPTYGHKFGTHKKHLRLRVKQLICDSLTGMRFMQSLLRPYGQERGCRYQPAIWAGLDCSNTEAWEKGAESKEWGREGWNAL